MTREEAIKVLEMFLHKQCDLKRTEFAYDANTVWNAVYMASKALEQEPCDDCVSRQALLEFFKDDDYVVNEINNMPPVLPKREHGEWIEHPHECGENWEFSKYECSICHMWEENDSDFCPNCGAEMR